MQSQYRNLIKVSGSLRSQAAFSPRIQGTSGMKAVSATEEDKEEKGSEKIKDNGATATDVF